MQKEPESHYFKQKLDGLMGRLLEVETVAALPTDLVDLAKDAVLAWAAGKLSKDWLQEAGLSASEVQRLKDAGVWPW
jgi:hypothetical protein